MKEQVNISVIVPNYNNAKYIEYCIDSLFKQTYQPFEVIVVDDCSTDNSREILEKLSLKYNKLVNIFLEKNAGVSHARNTGINAAKGNYIVWMDADDFVINDRYFEVLAKHCRKNRVVYGRWLYSDSDGKVNYNFKKVRRHKILFSKSFAKLNSLYYVRTYIFPRNFILSREVLDKAGRFNEQMSLYEDSDMMFRIARYAKFKLINIIGPAYRQTSNGLSKAPNELHKQALESLRAKYEDKRLTRYRKHFMFRRKIFNKLAIIFKKVFR